MYVNLFLQKVTKDTSTSNRVIFSENTYTFTWVKLTFSTQNISGKTLNLSLALTLCEDTEGVEHQDYNSRVLHVWAADRHHWR